MSDAQRLSNVAEIDPAIDMTVEHAFRALKRIVEPDVLYDIAFDDIDGHVFKRFARKLPCEAWIVARPVHNDGSPRRDKEPICAALAFSLRLVQGAGGMASLGEKLKRDLVALVEADS